MRWDHKGLLRFMEMRVHLQHWINEGSSATLDPRLLRFIEMRVHLQHWINEGSSATLDPLHWDHKELLRFIEMRVHLQHWINEGSSATLDPAPITSRSMGITQKCFGRIGDPDGLVFRLEWCKAVEFSSYDNWSWSFDIEFYCGVFGLYLVQLIVVESLGI
nr:hypothetical protein Iba_chr02aCG9700 [Ipomoea batatas]